ncbi:ROK family protein [Geitlerinema splendidum]|nr:ROK family protein [Geitlerinema splendidum]
MRCVIGVDLGGTNVRAQAVYEDGSPAGGRVENPSHAQSGTEEILDALSLTIQQAIDSAENEVAGVGLAIPGHIDDAAGLVKWSPNFGKTENGVFSYWKDVEIRRPLRERLGVDVKMANDANCAALGEYLFGSGKGTAHCLVLFTIGTGVGGGVVFGEQSLFGNVSGPAMLLGGNLGGGELGHNIVQRNGLDCNAGSYGALEAYCQRDAIITRAHHKLRRGRPSIIPDLLNGDLGKLSPATLGEAAEMGDALALEIWEEVGGYLGTAAGSMINIFAPDVLAIGGQISKSGKWFLPSVQAEADKVAIPSLMRDCTICLADQVEDAGLLGGAALVFIANRSQR